MKKLLLITACAALALPAAALAQPHGGGGGGGGGHWSHGGGHGGPHFSAGAINRFGAHDLGLWRGGHWFHGDFGGRFGWWWWADGFWYWYDQPAYPYPLIVGDVYQPDDSYNGPDDGGYAGGPGQDSGPAAGPPGPPPAVWYYCNGPQQGYYPYVRSCPSGWRTVPATPPDYQGDNQYAPQQDQGPPDGPPPPRQ